MQSFENKRVFISGGAGVIGTALVKKLLMQDAIVAVGDLKPRPCGLPESVIYWEGDLNDCQALRLHDFKPEVFFHLAATFERSEETYAFWEDNFQNNIRLSHHLMTLAKELECLKKVVFASSYLIYDSRLYIGSSASKEPRTLQEGDSILPRNLTGSAKLNHEIELDFLSKFLGDRCQFVSARIFRVYGKGSRDVVSRWIRMALAGESLAVYGKESFFDYIYADDVAEGLLRMAKNENAQGVINLGSGRSRRVADVLAVLKQHFPQIEIKEGVSAKEYEASQADMSYCRSLLGWSPAYSLEKAIPEIIEYERSCKKREHDDKVAHPCGVLVSSLSRKVPLVESVRDAAERFNRAMVVWGADANSQCIGERFVDHFWEMPPLAELGVEEIITYCDKNNIRYIIPSRDGELSFWAEAKSRLAEHGIHVMVSSPKTVQLCLDKLKFYQELSQQSIPVIATAECAKQIDGASYVIKERYGAGSIGVQLNVDLAIALEEAKRLDQPLFQPYIQGREWSADIYRTNHGVVKGVAMRWRSHIVGGESHVSTTFYDPELEHLIHKVVRILDLKGHAVLQGFMTPQREIFILEVNARFGGASVLGIKSGVDSFKWFFEESVGKDLSDISYVCPRDPMRLVRFSQDHVFML